MHSKTPRRIVLAVIIGAGALTYGCGEQPQEPPTVAPIPFRGTPVNLAVPGEDVFDSSAEVRFTIEAGNGLGLPEFDEVIWLKSKDKMPARVIRQALADGRIVTEMASLQLSGESSIGRIRVSAGSELDLPPSPGVITDVEVSEQGTFVRGNSSFDINVRIEIGDPGIIGQKISEIIVVSNCESLEQKICKNPIKLRKNRITELPPAAVYDPGDPAPIPIFSPGGAIVGRIVHTSHITERGCCQFSGPACGEPPRKDCEDHGGRYIRGGSCNVGTGSCTVPPGG